MEIWDKIKKKLSREDGAADEAAFEADALDAGALEEDAAASAQPLDALETPEGPPERRTSDEMLETMMASVVERTAGEADPETAACGDARAAAEPDAAASGPADTGWEFQTWDTGDADEAAFEEADTDPVDDEGNFDEITFGAAEEVSFDASSSAAETGEAVSSDASPSAVETEETASSDASSSAAETDEAAALNIREDEG